MFIRTIGRPLHHAYFLTSVLAFAGGGVAAPAHAATAYDGRWSVVVTTRAGACPADVRYGVDIANGQIISSAGDAEVQGRVMRSGAVNVTVRSGGAWAVGSGRLGGAAGGGVWRGQASGESCDGTWVAQRSGPATAETTGYGSEPAAGAAPGAAGCEARFRSYNPATGTYLGYDGLRHHCP